MTKPIDSIRGLDELRQKLGREWPAIGLAAGRSDEIRARLSGLLVGGERRFLSEDANFVVFGSLARCESTVRSDLDWTYLIDGEANPEHLPITQTISDLLEDEKFAKPGPTGVFGNMAFSHEIIHQIGGINDTNRNMTQRILLLLESSPIVDRGAYDRVIAGILYRYIQEDTSFITDYGKKTKIPRFLLNDIVRFWRTMAVDFASKQRERAGDGWGLRNVKLRMSRKLIFASGILTCFSCLYDPSPALRELNIGTDQAPIEPIVNHLKRYVNSTPLDIVAHGLLHYQVPDSTCRRLFDSYDFFLDRLNDETVRQELVELRSDEAQASSAFQSLREVSHTFQDALTEFFFGTNEELFKLLRIT